MEKTDVFVTDPQETKVDQNCYIDLLKTSLLTECRDGFEDSMFEAKASSLRGQGQGQFSLRPRTRPRPVLLEAKAKAKASIFEAKAKASDHNC